MATQLRLVRRSFLHSLGLALGGLSLGEFSLAETGASSAGDPQNCLRPNVFVHVATTGLVSIACARSEMGQGVRSTLPALIADELGADFAKVKIVQADGDRAYGDQNTDGSTSVRKAYDRLRRTGAAARMMLEAAAAHRWGVPATEIVVRDHVVSHPKSQRSAGLGELAQAASTLPVPSDEKIVLRKKGELRVLGKKLPLVDAQDIVTGQATFGADVKVAGLLTAVIARPPVAGGRVRTFDSSRALEVPGVKKVVALPAPALPFKFQPLGGVAVVADNTWAAMRGRARLKVEWVHGENEAHDSVSYRKTLQEAVEKDARRVRDVGDFDAAFRKARRRHEAVYFAPYLAHATMEPPVAVAKMVGEACEVWASTQNPQSARTEVARALGLDESKVTVHVTLLGGGFGRKSKPDYVVEAALLAKELGAPVRVQWSREDDIRHDYYHSASAQRFAAGLDEAGKIVAWHQRTAFPPIGSLFSGTSTPNAGSLGQGFLDVPLNVPNLRGEACDIEAHTRIGWLRSVANIYHAFAVHSFSDELAHLRGVDPLDNQRELLGTPKVWSKESLGVSDYPNYGQSLDEHPIDTSRHLRVLERAAQLADWSGRKKAGRSLGLAVHRSFLAYVAVIISVQKKSSGKIFVDEAWIVADSGTIVNLERVRSQFEGAVIFGLSQALYGEVTMDKGRTVQGNFRDFRLLRLPEAPRAIHVEVIESDAPPAGVGEPGVPPVAPALANAIFELTGTRVRELPLCRKVRV